MQIETCVVGQMAANCYLVYCESTKEALIIDPGDDADYLMNKIRDLSLIPVGIITTHGHFDHILSVTELKLAYNIPFYLHEKDLLILKRTCKTAKHFLGIDVDPPLLPDVYLTNNMVLNFGKEKLKVMETPGHTPGSICLLSKKDNILISGDTIFAQGGVGRTDLAMGNQTLLEKSLKKILKLDPITIIYPGHGETTTVEQEKQNHQNN